MTDEQKKHLSLAAAAWGVTECEALRLVHEFRSMPRQLVFDADFWPTLHFETQTRMAAGSALPPEFFALLFEALSTLGSHDIGLMKLDFRRFPAAAEDVAVRRIYVGEYGYISWRFAGANRDAEMHAIAGGRIVVSALTLVPQQRVTVRVE